MEWNRVEWSQGAYNVTGWEGAPPNHHLAARGGKTRSGAASAAPAAPETTGWFTTCVALQKHWGRVAGAGGGRISKG